MHQLNRLEAEGGEGGEATAKAGDDEQGDGCFALIGIPETGCEANDQRAQGVGSEGAKMEGFNPCQGQADSVTADAAEGPADWD